MKYLNQSSSLIDASSGDLALFVGPASATKIARAEEILGVQFPSAYREFLEAYGHGMIGPFEIYGITTGDSDPGSDALDVVGRTMANREFGLPKEFVAVYVLGNGEDYVIEPAMGEDPPVYAWSPGAGNDRSLMELVYPSFSRFFLDKVEEAMKEV